MTIVTAQALSSCYQQRELHLASRYDLGREWEGKGIVNTSADRTRRAMSRSLPKERYVEKGYLHFSVR